MASKSFTDYECEKIGMQRAATIKDIDITPKQCPGIPDQIANSKVAIARHDATNMNVLNIGAPLCTEIFWFNSWKRISYDILGNANARSEVVVFE